jgi:drug/metabolite transporter (DMT)-like permease
MGGDAKHQIQQLVGIACVNLASFVWATNMVLGRWLKDAIGPLSLSASRFVIASLIFAVVIRSLPPAERRIGDDWRLLAGMALTGVVLFSPVLYFGLHYTTAVNCTIINALSPLVTGLLAIGVLREPLSARQVAGAVVAACGVLYLISGGSFAFRQSALNIGDLIILLSVVIWGLYSVIGRKIMFVRSPLSATALSTFIGTPILCLLAAWELHSTPLNLGLPGTLAVVYVGAVPAALGFYVWNAGMKRLGPAIATIFINTLPLYGALLGYVFLDEPIGFPHLAGGALIIAGGIIATLTRRQTG